MDNIERFNRTAAAVFKALYQRFPTPIIRFDVESLREPAGIPPLPADARFNEMGDAVVWLGAEGFLRYSDGPTDGRHFTKVVLTQKGLEAMSRVPESVGVSVGDRLKELGRETSSQTVATLVQFAISGSAAALRGVFT